MTFRICHIGCGGMSVRGHGPALKEYALSYTDTELSGCCDIDASRAEGFKKSFGFKTAYTDWKKMLETESPDAVSLVVPVNLTAPMAVEILKSGNNLLTEKPPGMTVRQCRGIIDAAIGKLGVAFNRRYMPIVKQMKEILGNGRVDYVSYDFFRTGRKDTDFSTTAIHGIDTTLMLAGGKYEKINIEYQPLKSTPVGNIYISGKTKKGTKVRMNFYPDSGMNGERVVIISGSTTYFLNIPIWDCPDYPGSIRIFKAGVLSKEIHGDRNEMFITSGFYDEHRDFYESVRKGQDSPADMDQHLQSVEVMEAVRRNDSRYENS